MHLRVKNKQTKKTNVVAIDPVAGRLSGSPIAGEAGVSEGLELG